MTTHRFCRVCGTEVPHDSPTNVCGRDACQRAAIGPGADDVRTRKFTTVHVDARDDVRMPCPGPYRTPEEELEILGEGCNEPDPAPAPAPTKSLSDRLADAGRRRLAVWLEGHADLLRRCATAPAEFARAQPR